MNAAVLVDELTYRCYAHNRGLDPSVTPEAWAKVFPNAAAMEERYQREGVPAKPAVFDLTAANAGARMADDAFCCICGRRGTFRCLGC